MIFITVGSQKFPFVRLIREMDRLVESGRITEPVFAQIGHAGYTPKNFPFKEFMERDEFQKQVEKSDMIVTHGGTGTIIKAIKLGKKVVAVPRLEKYHEHVDDHQLQLISQFTDNHLINSCQDISELGDVIDDAREKVFAGFESNTGAIVADIDRYIEEFV